jgi:hypothetical protein
MHYKTAFIKPQEIQLGMLVAGKQNFISYTIVAID